MNTDKLTLIASSQNTFKTMAHPKQVVFCRSSALYSINSTFVQSNDLIIRKNSIYLLFLLFWSFLLTTNINAQRSPSLGTIDYFSNALTNTIRAVRLSDDKILVTWLDNGSSSSNNLKAIVGTVSGSSITFIPSDEVTITSNVFTTSHGLVSFSSTKAAIIYEANLATDEMKYNVLDITGTSIAVGGQDDFGPSGGLQVGTTKASSAVAISNTQLVVTYEEDIGSNDVFKVVAGTVSGTTITWGTAISPNSDDANNADVVRLTDSKFALAYEDQTASTGVGKLRIGTVNGSNGITLGIEETFANSFDINIAKLAALSETEIVVVWEYITGTQYANARYATISGTNITFPTQTIPTFYTDEGVDDMAIAALSATEFIVAVDGGSGDDSEVYTGVVSSNNITMTSDGGSVIITGQADDIQIAPLTSDKAVVVYTNDQGVGTTTADRGDYVVASYTPTTNPEINVQGNSVDIVSGDDTPSTVDHTDFGTGNPISRTFTIQNTGTGTLTLGSNAVTIAGTNASEFTVTTQPATTVSSSSSTTFTVEFSSLVASTRTAQININSDDVHEPNYLFSVQGVGAPSGGCTVTMGTVNFDSEGYSNSQNVGNPITINGFQFNATLGGTPTINGIIATTSNSASGLGIAANGQDFNDGDILTITTCDNSAFDFQSFYYGGADFASPLTVTGFKNSTQVATQTQATLGSGTFTLNSGFDDVDEVRITDGASSGLFLTFDDFVFGSASIAPVCSMTASITSQTDVACNGQSTGSLSATASSGTANYNYSWSNGATTNNSNSASNTVSSLAVGTYTVTITDDNSCTATASATITQPSSAVSASISSQTNVLCNGTSTGAATAAGSGGTGSYGYTWSSGENTASISGKAAGTYTITVTDGNGCQAQQTAVISQPATLLGGTIQPN